MDRQNTSKKPFSLPAVFVVDIGLDKYGPLEGNEDEDFETLREIHHRHRVAWKENRSCSCMPEEDRITDRLPTCKCWRDYIADHPDTKIIRDRCLARTLIGFDAFRDDLRAGRWK